MSIIQGPGQVLKVGIKQFTFKIPTINSGQIFILSHFNLNMGCRVTCTLCHLSFCFLSLIGGLTSQDLGLCESYPPAADKSGWVIR